MFSFIFLYRGDRSVVVSAATALRCHRHRAIANVETPSQGTKVPRQRCTKTEPTDLTVSWRDSLFPRHLATTRPVPALVSP